MACLVLLLSGSVTVVAPVAAPTLETVQVIATRNPKPASVVPAAVTVIEGNRLTTDTLGINLPEKLGGVAGVLARERQNYAQDVQISIRGFGARSTFGIRGLRLYLDGIPATMPDGQGQVSNFNLVSAGRIEILRGPFSALYGNASGGVIQMFTVDGATAPGAQLALALGSDDSARESLDIRAAQGAVDYNLAFTHFSTGGYREHSNAQRDSFNGRLRLAAGDRGSITLVANALSSPTALDPLGLTAQQMADDPRQAVASAKQFNSRKSLEHEQLGAIFERTLSTSQSVRVLAYGGNRMVTQFLAIPVAAQSSPLSGGGVVDLDSRFSGVDARWTYQGSLASRPLQLVLGLNFDQQDQHRLGFNNFLGAALGVRGLLRRDESNRVDDFDQYAEASWSPTERMDLLFGLRHSRVHFRSVDRFIASGNPDDSGQREFPATSPVFGISYKAGASWNLYASYGQGFETPTFDELGYRPDGSAGLNFALQPARTRSGELGAKARLHDGLQLDVAVFRADTEHELAVATNAGGRSTFQNVGQARRQGVELTASARLGKSWRSELSYTLLDASFRDAFLTCNNSPCATPSVAVPAGAQIPGVPRSLLHFDVDWQGMTGWHAGASGQYVDSMAVNNVGNARARPYTVFDLSGGYRFRGRHAGMQAFARIGNVLDRHYAGSVIVNETSGRYFEPAPGRTWLLGLDWRW